MDYIDPSYYKGTESLYQELHNEAEPPVYDALERNPQRPYIDLFLF
jgi:hypothetical protein